MRDGDHPALPPPEPRVGGDEGDDDGQQHQRRPEDVDRQRLRGHLPRVLRTQVGQPGQGCRVVEAGVEEPTTPQVVRQAVDVDVVVVVVVVVKESGGGGGVARKVGAITTAVLQHSCSHAWMDRWMEVFFYLI